MASETETTSIPSSWTPEYTATVASRRGPAPKDTDDLIARQKAMYGLPPLPVPEGVNVRPVSIPRVSIKGIEDDATGSIPAEWVEPAGGSKSEQVWLYIHGGAYCVCNPNTHRMITGGVAKHGVRVLAIDYRLAPQATFPAPIVDAISAHKYLLDQGISASNIFYGGDSAGGNCSLVTTLFLRDHPDVCPQPAGLALITPWVDLTGSDPTISLGKEFNADWLGRGGDGGVGLYASAYVGMNDAKLSGPLVSPLYEATPAKALPPVLVSLGTVDRCFGQDLAFLLQDRAGKDKIQVDVYADQVHVFPFFPELKQAQICYERMAKFILSNGGNLEAVFQTISYEGKMEKMEDGYGWAKETLAKLLERADKLPEWKNWEGKQLGPFLKAVGK